MRRADSLFANRAQTVPGIDREGLGWTRDVEAALAEVAVAKATGRFWDASQWRFRDDVTGDVGPLQVRSTTQANGHLVIRPHDRDDARFVFVVGVAPHYEIVGSILGRDAKRDEWKVDPGDRGKPCWFVPREALKPFGRPARALEPKPPIASEPWFAPEEDIPFGAS
jgi:hypothetical protein